MEVKFRYDARFIGSTFCKDVSFETFIFYVEYLTFKNIKFKKAYEQQEFVCRKAKKVLNEIGDKEESDDDFYLEMEAKRIQRGIRGNPGTTGYKITTELCQYVAMIETIVGTFLWAGFLATFAKKYMR
jgi:hypothetical protein